MDKFIETFTFEDGMKKSLDKYKEPKNPNEKVVICIGDSYNKNTEWWDGWGKCLKDNFEGFEVYSYEAGGGGFVANTYQYDFLGALQNHSQDVEVEDKSRVTDIVVLGGYNDVSVQATDVALKAAIKTFIAYCHENYPNAKVTIAGISFDYNSQNNQEKCNNMNMKYSQFATELGAATYPHFKYLLQAKSLIFFQDGNANSGFHPSTTGNIEVAKAIAQYLTGGAFDVRYGYVIDNTFVYRHNDKVIIMDAPASTVYPNGRTKFESLFNGKALAYNTWTDLGSLESNGECLLWGCKSGIEATWMGFTCNNPGGASTSVIGAIVFKIQEKHLYANNTGNTSTLTPGTDCFIVMPGTLVFDWQEII